MNLSWKKLDSFSDLGLLVMRLGVGALFLIVHGFPKLAGGPDKWESIGRAVSYLGIKFGYTGWGLAASVAETLGGLLLMIGFAHRPAALTLFVTMTVAAIWKYYPFGGWDAAAHPAAMAIVCLGLLFTGPGKYSLDAQS
ncbi:MAG TPA: DoxX family protein [Rariglobus sp.]|jgi:putative oxidoreductase|nr:DoxX family protein [Rariglobus sp.]